jgi:hypothetical protein
MVIAIKHVKTELPQGMTMYFHNPEDGKELNLRDSEEQDTNTWVPFQAKKKQIKIELKNGNTVLDTFLLWDDDYKLQCSHPSKGVINLLTVSGSGDVGLTVKPEGLQAHNA